MHLCRAEEVIVSGGEMSAPSGYFAEECEHGRRSDWWCDECGKEYDKEENPKLYFAIKKERGEAISLLERCGDGLEEAEGCSLYGDIQDFLEKVK